MIESSVRARVGVLALLTGTLLACRDGGANDGQQAPGDRPGGVALGIGDIAVSPANDFVVFERGNQLAVGWSRTGRVENLPIDDPSRLAFSKQRPVVYVGSTTPDALLAVDVFDRRVLWESSVSDASTTSFRVAATEDDAFVVSANARFGTVRVHDAADGTTLHTTELDGRIVDLVVLPDDTRALVVLDHEWEGDLVSTRVAVVDLSSGAVRELEVPNCADRVAVSGDGARAFLAPTTCIDPASARAKDPISLIDLTPGDEAFVRNLPGFGPVAVAPSGTTAVGFLDRDAIDPNLFEDPALIPDTNTDRFHLMLLDTQTLEYEFVEVGDRLPRFAITPDGNVLMVDSSWTLSAPARLFDVTERAWRNIEGDPLVLDSFVITSDSSHAYVIQNHRTEGLFDLDITGGTSREIPLSFAPTNINIAPDDRTLYLRRSSTEICVFSLETRRCEAAIVSETLVAP